MAVSYKKLWKLLIDKDMKKKDLCAAAGISHASMAKLGKNENVTTDVLVKICTALQMCIRDSYCEDMTSRLRENTLQSKKYLVERHILPFYEALKVNEITPAHEEKIFPGRHHQRQKPGLALLRRTQPHGLYLQPG